MIIFFGTSQISIDRKWHRIYPANLGIHATCRLKAIHLKSRLNLIQLSQGVKSWAVSQVALIRNLVRTAAVNSLSIVEKSQPNSVLRNSIATDSEENSKHWQRTYFIIRWQYSRETLNSMRSFRMDIRQRVSTVMETVVIHCRLYW